MAIGSATTAVAPASLGADTHADNESVAGVGDERGLSLGKNCSANRGECSWNRMTGNELCEHCLIIPGHSKGSREGDVDLLLHRRKLAGSSVQLVSDCNGCSYLRSGHTNLRASNNDRRLSRWLL